VTYLTVPALVAAAAEEFGEAPALITREDTQSFSDLDRQVAVAAGALRDRGIAPGDRVLLAAQNCPRAVHAWLAAMHAGALPAAVNPELTLPELRYLSLDLEPALILVDGERASIGARLAAELRVDFARIDQVEAGGAIAPHEADPAEPAAIVYTSGTTSRAKGVMVRHSAYTETGFSFPRWIGLGKAERLWACLPLFHINAQAYSLMAALAHGHGLALTPKFQASTFWKDARELAVTSVNVVGAMLAILERQPEERWVKSPLRTIYAAPAPPLAQRKRIEERFEVRISGGYGMSENTFGCAESPTSPGRPGSIGRPRQPASSRFKNELRIVTTEGRDATAGEVGELCFRNPVMTPGYWNAPEITEKALVDGWLRTGDAGYRDREGDVVLVGRFKEMIRRRGENIAPGEVEDALLSHPAVSAAAAFGVPSELSEDQVVAAVVLGDGGVADEAELKEWASSSLAAFKVPVQIVFRRSLPMTPTLRVARDQLRREFLAGQT